VVSGRLAALLAFLLPTRGRHHVPDSPAAAVPEPAPDEDEGVSPADFTRFDLPPGRVRPYVWRDEDGAP
jgi:hypothetical protein